MSEKKVHYTATQGEPGVTTGPKPGVKTTEFWLSLTATVLFCLTQAEVFGTSEVGKIAAAALAVLSNLGYFTTRAQLKK